MYFAADQCDSRTSANYYGACARSVIFVRIQHVIVAVTELTLIIVLAKQ